MRTRRYAEGRAYNEYIGPGRRCLIGSGALLNHNTCALGVSGWNVVVSRGADSGGENVNIYRYGPDMRGGCADLAASWGVGEKSETPKTSANIKARAAAGRDAANSKDTSVTSTDVCSDSNSLHYVSKMW